LSACNRFCLPPPSDDREELFGKLKFGADWQGRPIQTDLELLNTRFYPPDQYVPFEELSDPIPVPIEDLEYRGPEQLRDEASTARERFFKSKRQLEEVQELLRLLDKYGYQPKGPEHLERLDPGDDREKVREARRLAVQPAPVTGSNVFPMKQDQKSTPARDVVRRRGPKPYRRSCVKNDMLAHLDAGRDLSAMSEKQMEAEYGASRDTCRKARKEALSEFHLRQIPTNDK
jgi:hypothetical protein